MGILPAITHSPADDGPWSSEPTSTAPTHFYASILSNYSYSSDRAYRPMVLRGILNSLKDAPLAIYNNTAQLASVNDRTTYNSTPTTTAYQDDLDIESYIRGRLTIRPKKKSP
jgi:hypothetical protein